MSSKALMPACFLALLLSNSPALAGDEPKPFRYLEVPLKGEVGKEITAPGVKASIAFAKSRKATHVVFVIDTLGGLAEDGRAIGRIMGEPRGDLKYFVVVKRAISAGVWPMSQADRVFFLPSGAAGAAVAFNPTKEMAEQVNAKFNSAIAALLSANASARGQSGCVYRAMVVMDASLYSIRKPGGGVELTDQRPAGGDFKELDTPSTIFTLTPQIAEEIGFATLLKDEDVGAIGGIEHLDWESVGTAESQMKTNARMVEERQRNLDRARDRVEADRKRIADLAAQVASQVTRAQNASPSKLKLTYKQETGTLTGDSQNRSRDQTDVALGQWDEVVRLCSLLEYAQRDLPQAADAFQQALVKECAARLYEGKPDKVEVPPIDTGLDLIDIRRTASSTQADLRANRVRSRL